MEMKQVTAFIESVDSDGLDVLWAACKARQKALRSSKVIEGLATFNVGDVVELTGLSPKYLNGCVGTVIDKSGGKIRIKFTEDFDNFRATSRFGKTAVVPANCVQAVSSQLSTPYRPA